MTDVPPLDLLIFQLEGRRFGLPARSVEELVRAVGQTTLEGATSLFEGVINLRGSLVPVLDLRRQLGMTPRTVEPSDHLIIARSEGRRVALRVDLALELARFDSSDGDEVVDSGEPDRWIEGLAKHAAYGVIPVLSLESLLRDGRSARHRCDVATAPVAAGVHP